MDFNTQADPAMLLLKNTVTTQNMEIGIQAAVSNVLVSWSNGATDSINAWNATLTALAALVTKAGLTTNAISQANANYTCAQTKASTMNNQYSTTMQTGGTELTNLTDTESQNLQFASLTTELQDAINQFIGTWAS